jgi:hypothetical protein
MRATTYTGLHGETCYLLIRDHATPALAGVTRISTGSPLNWLRTWLKKHSPNVENKYVVLDQGGTLYNNPAVVSLFEEFDYEVHPTGAGASHQNGPTKRSNQTIGDALRSMLTGVNLDARFWPYAFDHFLRMKNALPSKNNGPSASELLHPTNKIDFTCLCTFGTRVWVKPPGNCPGHLQINSCKGIFLGYLPSTLILSLTPLLPNLPLPFVLLNENIQVLSSLLSTILLSSLSTTLNTNLHNSVKHKLPNSPSPLLPNHFHQNLFAMLLTKKSASGKLPNLNLNRLIPTFASPPSNFAPSIVFAPSLPPTMIPSLAMTKLIY